MRAAFLQVLGAVCIIIAAGYVAPMLGVLVAGIVFLVFGITEEMR